MKTLRNIILFSFFLLLSQNGLKAQECLDLGTGISMSNGEYAFIDFFNIRTEEDFLEKYAKQIITCSISKKEELLQAGKNFFKKIISFLILKFETPTGGFPILPHLRRQMASALIA